jgi:hypothetical protein
MQSLQFVAVEDVVELSVSYNDFDCDVTEHMLLRQRSCRPR